MLLNLSFHWGSFLVFSLPFFTDNIENSKGYFEFFFQFILFEFAADGKELVHKVDLKLNRSSICHEIGVTQRYLITYKTHLINCNPLINYLGFALITGIMSSWIFHQL